VYYNNYCNYISMIIYVCMYRRKIGNNLKLAKTRKQRWQCGELEGARASCSAGAGPRRCRRSTAVAQLQSCTVGKRLLFRPRIEPIRDRSVFAVQTWHECENQARPMQHESENPVQECKYGCSADFTLSCQPRVRSRAGV